MLGYDLFFVEWGRNNEYLAGTFTTIKEAKDWYESNKDKLEDNNSNYGYSIEIWEVDMNKQEYTGTYFVLNKHEGVIA